MYTEDKINVLDINSTEGPEVNDLDIIEKCLSGNVSEFNRLVYKYQKMVFNIAYGILSNRDDAVEVAQDVFIKIYRGLNRFRKESKFSTWLYRITVNQSISRKRHSSLRDKVLNSITDCNSPNLCSPEEIASKNEMQNYLYKALNRISPEERAIVNLRDIQQFSYEEIAKILGVNIGTVKSRLNRARFTLKQKIKKVMKDEV